MFEKYGAYHPSQSEICKAKRQKTFDEKYNGHQYYTKNKNTWKKKSKEDIKEIQTKKTQTFMDRYGYDNPFNDDEIKTNIAKLRTERGDWTDITGREDFYAYSRKVRAMTEQNYRKHKDHINPDGLRRTTKIHLDHILSVMDGFVQSISPEIVAHPQNLRLISAAANHSKSGNSEITLNDLQKMIEEFI
jgi:hypothetical protein